MYHLELRQFPHNLCRFNLTREQLQVLVEPWANDKWVELGERRWSPHQAKMTIVEGPQMPMDQLSMGRGWRQAQRKGQDVTEQLISEVRAQVSPPGQPHAEDAPPPSGLLADSLGLELLTLLDDRPASLTRAWSLACERCPERSASDCLALAEQALRSLLRSRLIVLVRTPAGTAESGAACGERDRVPNDQLEAVLGAADSWGAGEESARMHMRRA